MREIKFRAWDKERNIYGAVLSLEYPTNINDDRFLGHKGKVQLFNIENKQDCGFWGRWLEYVDLEQFTGLYDKNGKEIYEGDFIGYDQTKFLVQWSQKNGMYKCYFLGEGDNEYKVYCNLNDSYIRNLFSVIGNIHRASELLDSTREV